MQEINVLHVEHVEYTAHLWGSVAARAKLNIVLHEVDEHQMLSVAKPDSSSCRSLPIRG